MKINKSASRILISALAIPFLLSACADKSAKISATYVSPLKYRNYTCDQLTEEYARVLEESKMVNKAQDDIAGNDSVAMGVGLVLFWPALFLIDSDDKKEEVSRLKGEVKAIDQSAIQKNCSTLRTQIIDDKKAAAEAAKKAKEATKNSDDSNN